MRNLSYEVNADGSIRRFAQSSWLGTIAVSEGQRIPKWYGMCWYEYSTHYAICAPIPLNLIYGGIRTIYYWLLKGFASSALDAKLAEADRRGYVEAWSKAHSELYTHEQLRKAYHQGIEHEQARMLLFTQSEAYKKELGW